MSKYPLILFLLFFSLVSVGSNKVELLKDSLSLLSGEDKAATLYEIGTYYYLSNNDSTLFYLNKALAEYEIINNGKRIAKTYAVLGSIYKGLAIFDTAVALIDKAIKWGEENNDEVMYYAYFQLANTYEQMDQFGKAQVYYRKAIISTNQGIKLASLANMGILYLNKKNYDSASYYFSSALNEYYKLDTSLNINKFNIAAIYLNLSAVDFGRQEYEKGIPKLNKSLKLFEETEDKESAVYALLNLGEGYRELKQIDLSTTYYLKAKEIADTLQNIIVLEEVYYRLGNHYEKIGNLESAIVCLRKHEKYHDSLIINSYKGTIAEMEVKYSLKEKNNLIVDLMREKQNIRLRAISVIVSLFFLSLVIILLINRRRLKLRNAKALADAKSNLIKVKHETTLREFERIKVSLHEKSAFIEELEDEVKKLSINNEKTDLEDKIQLLRETRILTDDDWERYNRVFNEIHPLFCNSVKNFDDLSNGDRRQIIFLKLGLKQKEIAYLMGITPEGVKRARQRVAKKVGLNNAGELKEYIEGL